MLCVAEEPSQQLQRQVIVVQRELNDDVIHKYLTAAAFFVDRNWLQLRDARICGQALPARPAMASKYLVNHVTRV